MATYANYGPKCGPSWAGREAARMTRHRVSGSGVKKHVQSIRNNKDAFEFTIFMQKFSNSPTMQPNTEGECVSYSPIRITRIGLSAGDTGAQHNAVAVKGTPFYS